MDTKRKKYTIGMREENRETTGVFEKENYCEELVVQDGNLITARGESSFDLELYMERR
ncbi:hypothetical protein M1K46_24585 [Fictibacillus sp. WQ 8-8]|uniref:hypothetical protein n=1 Tax=Fictibacillus sp. WQ 8-8 TaxID=2938788 RepID=UPI00210D32BC|nr:hypothetical protein [Fictibacillus sp. WQ 8-8]MCQ6268754.1 hypothetical protein [Fictibacillus sp. WQ 8-8]